MSTFRRYRDLARIEKQMAEGRKAAFDRVRQDFATDWLRDYLAGGPLPANVVLATGLLAGHRLRHIYGAQRDLGIVPEQRDDEKWWALPADAELITP